MIHLMLQGVYFLLEFPERSRGCFLLNNHKHNAKNSMSQGHLFALISHSLERTQKSYFVSKQILHLLKIKSHT